MPVTRPKGSQRFLSLEGSELTAVNLGGIFTLKRKKNPADACWFQNAATWLMIGWVNSPQPRVLGLNVRWPAIWSFKFLSCMLQMSALWDYTVVTERWPEGTSSISTTMSMNSSKQPVFPAAGLIANTTCQTQNRLSVFFSIIFMTVGILSNSLAIAILMKAYQRFRQKSKASFLLLASGLVITDFFGHLINGGIAVFVYASDKDWIRFDQSNILCSVFGISMVFSGLCPLFLGSVMAIERCIGVTNPIFHSTKITSKHVKMILGGVCMFAIFVALLPILGHRDYQIQASRTWCFYNTEHIEDWEDRFYLLFFSFLGLLALGVSFLCNAITGVTLLRVKFKSQQHRQGRSHHFEMVIQLLAIMCVSCICWSPFLVRS